MKIDLIQNVTTRQDLVTSLKQLGVADTDAIIAHTALSKFYYIPGGPTTVVAALEETVKNGTLIMPSEVTSNCDPAAWEYPPVRQDLIQKVKDTMPPYNAETSITEGLGQTPEYFRKLHDVVRSNHPYLPVAIWGKNKEEIAKKQRLNLPYGIDSPLEYLYQNNGKIVFLGTDYETCTMLHYAESTINRKTEICSAATSIDKNGKTVWTNYYNVDMDSYDDFNELGTAFEKSNPESVKSSKLANGTIKVVEIRPLIDFARNWFKNKDNKFGNSLN